VQFFHYSADMRFRSALVFILLATLSGSASAKPWWMRGVESNENDFLPPDVAFAWAHVSTEPCYECTGPLRMATTYIGKRWRSKQKVPTW